MTTNFAFLIRPSTIANPQLHPKFEVIGKYGYFCYDALGIHLILIIALALHLGIRAFSSKFTIMQTLYAKINPYLLAYTFRLIALEFSLDLFLYLSCF